MLTAVVVVAVFSLPATLSAAHGNCSYLLTNSSDFIDSNDYMGPGPRKNECFFQIQKPSGLSKDWSVQLRFLRLDLEGCGSTCGCGYLEFLNGEVDVRRLCDFSYVDLNHTYSVNVGYDTDLKLRYHADPNGGITGFELDYEVLVGHANPCANDSCDNCYYNQSIDFLGCCRCASYDISTAHIVQPTSPTPTSPTSNCSRIYDNNAVPDGVISNLRDNSTYVNESECYYTIKMPNISYYHGPWTVNIRFLRLDLEGCGSTCGCGYLEFLNGEVDVRRLCDFSYVDLNHTYSVNVGYDTDLKLYYHADPNDGITGFELDYEVLVGHANPCANDSCDNCYYNQSIDFLGCCRCASYDISTAHIVPPTSPTPSNRTIALLDLLYGIVNNVIRIEDDLRRVRYDVWKAYYLTSSLNITQADDGGY
ncbi:uncharacterized protein [Haliotis cracherodii]|uniref:uncharacterized protein n=1 Tax=Haliotis cracherodii TaxID=6455 RepID=UPI0039EC4A08